MAPAPSPRKSILIMGLVTCFVVITTIIISLFARGYRLDFENGPVLSPTGLISATSRPKSASVYLNNRLFTATDDTINLPPGDYAIKIIKDGYLPWEKNVTIVSEVVYQTDADLFRSSPDLRPVSLTGAINPVSNQDNTKIAYSVASASATKDNGLYLYENNNNLPLPLIKNSPHQLSANLLGIDWSKAEFTFSPNGKQLLANFKTSDTNYLFNLDNLNSNRSLYDISPQLSQIAFEWTQQEDEIIKSKLDRLPKDFLPLISSTSAKDILFSSGIDNELILYLASNSGQINGQLISPPPAQSTQKQDRNLVKNNYYVYDPTQDTNFLIGSKNDIKSINWIPNTNNLVYVQNNEIRIIEYDGTNKHKLYAGNFNQNLIVASLDGTHLITLTNAYPGAQENLYAITIK